MQVRNQDAIFLLRGVCSGAHEVAWQWLKVLTDALILPWLVLQLLFFLGVLANSMTATISGKLGLHIRSLLWNSAHLLRQHNCLTGKQHSPPASHVSCNPTFIIVILHAVKHGFSWPLTRRVMRRRSSSRAELRRALPGPWSRASREWGSTPNGSRVSRARPTSVMLLGRSLTSSETRWALSFLCPCSADGWRGGLIECINKGLLVD